MGRPERHDAVGAYALDLLEPYDALCCAEHVTRCAQCAWRLAEFAEVAAALAQLTGRTPLSPPPRRTAPPAVRPPSGPRRVAAWPGRLPTGAAAVWPGRAGRARDGGVRDGEGLRQRGRGRDARREWRLCEWRMRGWCVRDWRVPGWRVPGWLAGGRRPGRR
ncbi:hypothetical protein AB0H29_27970 [Streptomyces thermolilacinus]